LVLKTHLHPTSDALGGRVVEVQVLLESKALYSSCIVVYQIGEAITVAIDIDSD